MLPVAADALTLSMFVVTWRSDAPIEPSAARRRFVAVTFLVLPVALTMSSPLRIETFVAVTLPTITSRAAFKRAEEPVASTFAVPSIVKVPVSASMLIVPGAAVVTLTFAVNSMSLAAVMVMSPVSERMSAFAVMLPASASIRMLPVPFAAIGPFTVKLPVFNTRIIAPFVDVRIFATDAIVVEP